MIHRCRSQKKRKSRARSLADFIPIYPVSAHSHKEKDSIDHKTIVNLSNCKHRFSHQIFISSVAPAKPVEKALMTLSKDRRSLFLASRESESSWRVHVRTHACTRVSFLALGVGIGGPRLVSRSSVPPLPYRGGGSTTLADRMARTLSRPAAPKSLGRATRSHRASPRAVLFRTLRDPSVSVSRSRKSLARVSPCPWNRRSFSRSDRLRRFNNLGGTLSFSSSRFQLWTDWTPSRQCRNVQKIGGHAAEYCDLFCDSVRTLCANQRI